MNINRRDAIKLGATSLAAVAIAGTVSGCNTDAVPTAKSSVSIKTLGQHKVVIIGGGFGGLTVANNLKKKNKNLDVLVIEKNDTFMSCPVSNTYLGKLEGMDLGKFIFDYAQPVQKHGYNMLKSEVVAIDRTSKTVTTAAGVIGYGILVLSPGIAYDYEAQFPTWSKEKVAEVQRTAPAALIPGSEHIALERMLANMEDGDVIITAPSGKFRCPPAPFERASMIAAYMDKEDIRGKVIVLNPKAKFAKFGAFMESWKDLYADRIIYIPNAKIDDVDVAGKSISFTQQVPTDKKDTDGFEIMKAVKKSHKYEVLNLIPSNKANPVVQMATLKTTTDSFHKVVMNGCSFQTATDNNVYAVGDVVAHGIPPSAQSAVWAGKQCAAEITARLAGQSYALPVKSTTVNAGNVCYSMVGDRPEEGIVFTHDFSWNGKIIEGKGNFQKATSNKYRSKATAKALRDWYSIIMANLFA